MIYVEETRTKRAFMPTLDYEQFMCPNMDPHDTLHRMGIMHNHSFFQQFYLKIAIEPIIVSSGPSH